MMATCFSNLWFYDFPQIFEDQIISRFGVSTVEVSLLYSVYSIPNVFFCFLGPLILNYTGLGIGVVFTTALAFFGAFLAYIGVAFDQFWLILVGRAVYGLGAEVMLITQTSIAEKWYSGSILSLAIAFSNVSNMLGTAGNAYFSPLLLTKTRCIEFPLFVTVILCFVCWVFGLIYYRLEARYSGSVSENSHSEGWQGFRIKDIKFFKPLFWVLIVYFCCLSMSYFQFINFVTDFLVVRFNYEYLEAKNLVGLIPIVACIAIPVISPFTLKFGKKGVVLVLAALMGLGTYFTMSCLPEEPGPVVLVWVFLISIFYSLYTCVIWTCLTLLVPTEGTSVGLGIATGIENMFMVVLPFLFGEVNKNRSVEAYNNSLMILQAMLVVALIFGLFVAYFDFKGEKILHLPENHHRVISQREELSSRLKEESLRDVRRELFSRSVGSLQSRAKTIKTTSVFSANSSNYSSPNKKPNYSDSLC